MSETRGQPDAVDLIKSDAAGSVQKKFAAVRNSGDVDGQRAAHRAVDMLAEVRIEKRLPPQIRTPADNYRNIVITATCAERPYLGSALGPLRLSKFSHGWTTRCSSLHRLLLV